MLAPNKVKVQLFRNGKAFGKYLELTSDKLKNKWENLEISDDIGNKYNYEIKELDSRNEPIEHNGSIIVNQKKYKVSYEGNIDSGFKVINKEEKSWTPMIPPTRKVKVTKEWQDNKGEKIDAPVKEIEVQLYKNGIKEGEVQKLNSENSWAYTFENLKDYEQVGEKNYKIRLHSQRS